MFTSWSEQSTPAELSMASVLIRPPASAYSTRPRWVNPRLPPSATTVQRSSLAVDADRVVGAVTDVVVRLGARLHERADAAVPEEVDGRAQDRPDAGRSACERLGVDTEQPAHLGRDRHRLGRAREHATARGDDGRVVVGPLERGSARTATASSNRRRRSA